MIQLPRRAGRLAFFVPCLALVLLCGWRISSPGEPSELLESTLHGGGGGLLTSLIPAFGHKAKDQHAGVNEIGPPASAAGPSGGGGGGSEDSGRAPLVRNLLRKKFQHPRRPARRQISGGGKVAGAPVEYSSVLPASLSSFFDALDVKDHAIDASHRSRRAAHSPRHSATQAAHDAGLPDATMRVGPASLNDYFDTLSAKGPKHAAAKLSPSIDHPPAVSLNSYFDSLGGAQRGAGTLIGGGPAGVRGRMAAVRRKAKTAKPAPPVSLNSYFDSLGGAQRGAATLIGGGGWRARGGAVMGKAKKAKLAKLSGVAARKALNRCGAGT